MDPSPAPSLRERQRLDTHRHIFRIAAAEICRHGTSGTSMAAIAKAAGVSRQTVYDHFPTLDSVVAEAFAGYQARVAARLLGRIDDATPLRDLLDELVEAFFGELGAAPPRLRAEAGAYLVRGVEAETGGWIQRPLFQLVSTAFRREQRAGRVVTRMRPDDWTWLVLTCLAGFLLIESEPLPDRARRAHAAVGFLMGGVAA